MDSIIYIEFSIIIILIISIIIVIKNKTNEYYDDTETNDCLSVFGVECDIIFDKLINVITPNIYKFKINRLFDKTPTYMKNIIKKYNINSDLDDNDNEINYLDNNGLLLFLETRIYKRLINLKNINTTIFNETNIFNAVSSAILETRLRYELLNITMSDNLAIFLREYYMFKVNETIEYCTLSQC
jgi:hypothetical protein